MKAVAVLQPDTVACCPPSMSAPLERAQAEQLAGLLKAVADPARLQLLSIIRASEDCEACVCDLTDVVGLSQPTVSHHLKVLVDAGILTKEKRGYWNWYRIERERLSQIAQALA